MQTNSLLFGLIGFFMGGLLVSVAATTFDKPETDVNGHSMMSLDKKTGDDFDEAFISGMIVHHEGAIDMARLAESSAKHQEIKDLSEDILTAQQKEIDMMKQWQKDWGYETTSSSDGHMGDGDHHQ